MIPELVYKAVGRDKTAVARVFITKGIGNITINGKNSLQDYFKLKRFVSVIMQPLNLVDMSNSLNIKINVKGSGSSSQADAVRLAIAKALLKLDDNLRSTLRNFGLITTDKRQVERKKPGRRKARKQEQYSKR